MGWLNLVNSPYGNSAINLFIKDTLPAEEIQNEEKKIGKGKLSFCAAAVFLYQNCLSR
jgi:hypothetical protein